MRLMQFVMSGIETSFMSNSVEGIGSAFHFLEIAHTHFTVIEVTRNEKSISEDSESTVSQISESTEQVQSF